ncbi:MAG: AAA family ATPase [Rhodobacteraceae bacterium]|nr:AAA family ATPase [Paracoccaceae bacterium]
MLQPKLIIFSGLPGTGKTTIARRLANHLRAVYLRIDTIEAALVCSSLKLGDIEDAGYVVAYGVAADDLQNGHTVIADSVNPIELTRNAWREATKSVNCHPIDVEIVCSDKAEHRCRVETRKSDLAGKQLPSWQDVLNRKIEPWTRKRIIVDTAGKDVEQSVEELLSRLAD